MGRVSYELTVDPQDEDGVFATFSEGRASAVDTDPANGLDGRAPSGNRFFERLYVQGRRSRIGTDMEWNPGRWRVIAQALRARDARDEQGLDFEDLPALLGVGWSVELTRHFGRQPGPRLRLREWDVPGVGNASVEGYSEPRSAPEPGRESRYWVFGTRLQFELP